MPFEVPSTILVEIARQVGWPKLRFPTSDKAWLVILRNLVHRTTSQGPCNDSGSSGSAMPGEIWLANEDWREWIRARYGEGEGDPGLPKFEDDSLD